MFSNEERLARKEEKDIDQNLISLTYMYVINVNVLSIMRGESKDTKHDVMKTVL